MMSLMAMLFSVMRRNWATKNFINTSIFDHVMVNFSWISQSCPKKAGLRLRSSELKVLCLVCKGVEVVFPCISSDRLFCF